MQVEYTLKLGTDEFKITATTETETEFFEKLSFFANLPKVGPNGETDLKLTFRTTTKGYKYYSIVSEEAGQEFKLGQVKEDAGSLFPKGWEPLYSGNSETGSDEAPAARRTSTSAPATTAPASQAKTQEAAKATAKPSTSSSLLRRGTTTAQKTAPAAAAAASEDNDEAAPATTNSASDLINRYGAVKSDAAPAAAKKTSSLLRR